MERPRVWAARSAVEIVGARSMHGRRLACRAHHAAYPDPGYKDATTVLDVTCEFTKLYILFDSY